MADDQSPAPFELERARFLEWLDESRTPQLLRFAQTRFGSEWLRQELDIFRAPNGAIPGTDVRLALLWVLFSTRAEVDGPTIGDLYVQEERGSLSPDARLILDAHGKSWLSIWHVTSARVGVGATLVDLLTGEQRFVCEDGPSSLLQPGNALLGVVLDCDGVAFISGAHGQPLLREDADHVVSEIRHLAGASGPIETHVLRGSAAQATLLKMWNARVDAMRTAISARYQQESGEWLEPTTDIFDLAAPIEEVVELLARLFRLTEENVYDKTLTIREARGFQSDGEIRWLCEDWEHWAEIALTRSELRIATSTPRDADTARRAIAEVFGPRLRFRVRESRPEWVVERARAWTSAKRIPSKLPIGVGDASGASEDQRGSDRWSAAQ